MGTNCVGLLSVVAIAAAIVLDACSSAADTSERAIGAPSSSGGVAAAPDVVRATALLSFPAAAAKVLPESLGFPFSVRGFDASSPISAAFLNDHAAGSRGWVSVDSEGHLVLQGRRIRFFGLNCTAIPTKSRAPELARRLAALGVNIVRLHHIDASWGKSLLAAPRGGSRAINAAVLDDLDYFAAELFRNGIYVNLNLLTGRLFSAADGLPGEIETIPNFKSRHALGFWRDDVRLLQEEYARGLLGHVNPYTGRAWKAEPGVAVVEINNENGLLQAWLSGWLEGVPAVFTEDLRAAWIDRLKSRYVDDAGLEERFVLGGLTADANARVNFTGIGLSLGAVEIKDWSFRQGGSVLASAGSLADGKLPLPTAAERAGLPSLYLDEWLAFLYETEDRYWERMRTFLKEELGVKSLLTGTIVGCSTPGLQSRFDIIDAHSYWNHPSFPGKDWDGNDWYVGNTPMLRAPDVGNLGELAFLRVKGKPFSVSEYDHPWPNQYAFEMYPLLAAFAAYQDWDLIYGFTVDAEDDGSEAYIVSYFDQLGNPLKAAALPFAARIFRQALVPPAADEYDLVWDRTAERAKLAAISGWSVFSRQLGGWDKSLALSGRVALTDRAADGVAAKGAATKNFPWNAAAGGIDLNYPNLSLQIWALAPFAPLRLAAFREARGYGFEARGEADLGVLAAIAETDPATGKDRVVVLDVRAAGNTGEALAEYSGPVTFPARQLKDPLTIANIRGTWKRGTRRAWALSNPWTIDYPAGFGLCAVNPAGLARRLPEVDAHRLDPEDGCLWYVVAAE